MMHPDNRFLWYLLGAFLGPIFFPFAIANTEKVIFSAPDAAPVMLEARANTIGELSAASGSEVLLLRTKLPRAFPTEESPRGIDSWVYLGNLKPNARYEVRVCWAATTPSDFWMSVSPEYLLPNEKTVYGGATESHLYLKISSIASYYTTNASLMANPEPVLVDIILDEFMLGVLPRSLVNVVIAIVALIGVSWYLGLFVVKWFENIVKQELKDKTA